ncbi:MAG: hypothetical protein CL930_00720 [Deltaproteobacteria bacterium]|nr:hypothetical protein [Deltaproteobacteria bacterium]|tara:strand:- start:738 stop:1565 length:828 start_codon:yes stop_codon:yes gene_type:complete
MLLLAVFVGTPTTLSGCGDVVAKTNADSFKVRARKVRNDVKTLRPGELGPFLDGQQDEKLRYVIYRKLESQRERLRSGNDRWMAVDLVALTETSKRDMNADYQPLRAVAKSHHVWARLEGFEAGQMSDLLDGQYVEQVVGWVNQWGQSGRPHMEGRLNRHDLTALQEYAIERLPDTRRLLRWTFEQDQRPGQVAGFLGRNWSEKELVSIMRMWCTSEGWTPLAHAENKLTKREKDAVFSAFVRLEKSSDPLVRREAKRWRSWFEVRVSSLAAVAR